MERQRTGRMANRQDRGLAGPKVVRDVERTRRAAARTRRGLRLRRELFGDLRVGRQELLWKPALRVIGVARTAAGDSRSRR